MSTDKRHHEDPKDCELCKENAQKNAFTAGCLVIFMLLFFGTILIRILWDFFRFKGLG